jgi:hypothetical protein
LRGRAIHLTSLSTNFIPDIDRTQIAINKIVLKLRRAWSSERESIFPVRHRKQHQDGCGTRSS